MRPALWLLLALLAGCARPPDRQLTGRPPGLDVADVALLNGAPDTALRVADGILARNPDNVAALVRAGQAQALLGRPVDAARSFTRALALAPDDSGAALGLGRLELGSDPSAAVALLTRLTTREPANVAALTDLGIANDLQGKHAEAQAAYRKALAIEPNRTAASANLGLSLALSGDTGQAIGILQPLADKPDASPRVRQNLAAALVLAGRSDEAEMMLQPDMPRAQVVAAIAGYRSLLPRP